MSTPYSADINSILLVLLSTKNLPIFKKAKIQS